jgi:hypothetical protein
MAFLISEARVLILMAAEIIKEVSSRFQGCGSGGGGDHVIHCFL